MKNRKWQRILSWVLTLTMLLGTFESNILAVNAMDDEAIEADAEIDEADVVEADEDVEEPEVVGATGNTMTAVAVKGGTGADYTNAWLIQPKYGQALAADPTFTATISGNTAKTVTWKVLDTNWKETTLPAGMTGTANGREFAISGAPNAISSNTVILSAISDENSSISVNGYVKIDVQKLAKSDLNPTGDADWTIGSSAITYRMGYTVDASATSSSTNVVSKTITLVNTTGSDITDLSAKLTSGVSFNLANGGENISLPNNGKLELVVAPKEGLIVNSKTSYNDVENFTDTLTISSKVLDDSISFDVKFNLGYNMEISATKDGAAFTADSITVSAGNAMPAIAFTVTGGNGDSEWNEAGIKDKLPAGVTANRNGNVVTISGTPTISSDIVKAGGYKLEMTAKDNKNQSTGNNTISKNFTINVGYADVAYTANGDTKDSLIKFGNKNDLQSEDALTIVATNKGESEITVNASLDSDKFYFTNKSATDSAKIAAGSSATFTVFPKLNSISDDTVKVTLSGNALQDKVFTYRLVLEEDVLMIVDPVDGKLPSANMGEDYSYTFKADGTVSLNALTWTISTNEADPTATLSANELKDQYGLTLSANGLLHGTPKAISENGVKFLVTVSGNGIVSTNEVTLKIVSTNKAIVVSANGVVLSGKTASDNIVSLGTINTKATSVSNNTAKIVVKNTSSVNVGTVTITIDKVEKKNASGNYVDVPGGSALVKLYQGGLDKPSIVFNGDSNTSIEFSITPVLYAIRNADPADAGEYRALVKVNSNKNLVAKEFYVTCTLQNTVEITTPNATPFVFTVNTAITPVSFNAVSKNGADKLTNVEWSWTASGNSTLPEGLTLSQNGTLYGTPAKAGVYSVSVSVLDKTTNDTDTKSYVVSVNGAATIALTEGSGTPITNHYFPGVVKDAAITATEFEVAIKHTSGAALSDVKISLEDIKAGSAKHFKLSTDTIAKINVNGFEKFTIVPVDSTEAGEYAVNVVVSNNTIAPIKVPVYFTVVEKLTINEVDATKLAAEVGQAYSLTVSAATISYNGADQNSQITWGYKVVSENGAAKAENIDGLAKADIQAATYTIDGTPEKSGSYIVVVSANLPASKYQGTNVNLAPAQKATAQFTIEVSKSASVNVIGAIGNASGYSTGKSTPETPSASNNVTAYTFASRAEGYTNTNLETVAFTVENGSAINPLTVSGNSSSTNFIVDTAFKTATMAPNATGTIKVYPKTGLAAGTYTADLVISSAETVDKVVTLSFTVEEAKDSISLSSNNTAIGESGLTLKPIKKGVAATDTTVDIKNSGNVDIKIVSINEVLDAAGTDIDINDTAKFKLTINKTNAINTAKIIPDAGTSFEVKPAKTDVAGEYTAYVKVTYSVGTAIKTPVVFAVNYTVYKDSVSVNVTPSQNTVSVNSSAVSENYTSTYSLGFSVANGEAGVAGDTTEALYDLRVSLSGNDADKFVLTADKVSANSTEYGADVIAKGASYSFSIAAVSGLSYGEYSAILTISADNMTTIKKTVTFTVTGRATSFATDATSAGVSVNVAVDAQRLYNTLAAASGVVSANDADKVWFSVSNDVVVSFNTVSRDNAVVYFATGHTTTKPSITVSAASINTANAVSDNKGNKYFYNTVTFNLFDIVTFDAKGGEFDGGKKVVSKNVVNGAKLGTLPSVSKNNASLKVWLDKDNYEVTAATTVSEDMTVTASWSTHHYPASVSGDTASVNWTWNGSASNNFAGTYVTIYCTDADCPDRAASAIKLDATITVTGEDATCTKGQSKVYTATASKDGNTYTDTKEVANDEGLGHKWVFDTTSVVWAADYSTATISKNCVAPYHNDKKDGDAKVAVTTSNISFNGVSANCTTSGNGTYTATFTSADDPAISENIVVSVDLDVVPALGHKWVVKSVESDGTFETAPTKGTLNIVCERDASHTESVSATTITFVSGNETEKTYKFAGKASDGQDVEKEETFYSHTEHVWDVKFTWVSVSTNKADTVVTAEATCKNGGEKKTLDVTLEDKTIGKKIEYTAKATDPNGKVWTSKKNIDTVTGEEKDGPAGTPTVEGGDIVIIGVEETYAFTGSKIKPAITVMDGDIVLAETTDYTYKVTGKNKIGEINKVEVTGKGNYAGKSATAQFTIVDPRTEVEAEELADNVKKVTVSEKKFTYDGTAKYPATITVDLKDKTQIVYTYDGDGEYSTDSEKKVGLSFSNNVKKGTATVAAYGGKDKSPKKATYKIEAADIASAEFEISAVDWAVKAATPDITATIQLGDETVELVAGQDYKVSFTAKAAGKGTAKISGKGNFKGKHADVAYDVNALEITENNIIVKALAGKKVKDVKVTVVDGLGNTINKKFYTVEVQDAEGNALDKKAALPEEIKVVVKAANASITTADDGVSVDVKTGKDISKVKGAFKVDKAFYKTYTGEPITLDADDFGPAKIVVGELELDTDFAIVGYKNNIKKGTMTVTVEGRGDYSGTKTFKVKIKAKPLDQAVKED